MRAFRAVVPAVSSVGMLMFICFQDFVPIGTMF